MAREDNIKFLKHISPSQIRRNPANPRIVFRQEEMDKLMVSIHQHGIQVPLTVYKDDTDYVLIDGERRWRCSMKLNLKRVPALIQKKPTELENLLLMSNIHALREQWDYFTIAINIEKIIKLFEKERNYTPNEIELSEESGLTRGQIRRCRLLLEMPDRFKEVLLDELKLPKSKQKLSEDFFIEMERSLKTVIKRLPPFENNLDEIRDTLVDKYKNNIIGAVTDFRQLSKIATAIENLGIKQNQAERALKKLFNPKKNIGIREIYEDTVGFGYIERKISQQIEFLTEFFEDIIEDEKMDEIDEDLIDQLKEMYRLIGKLLES